MTSDIITLGRAISLWEGSLRAQVKAESTIESYVRSVEYLEEALGRDVDPASIRIEDIELAMSGWRKRRTASGRPLGATTIRNRLVAMREFFKWGAKRYGWPNPTDGLDIPTRDEPVLRRLTVPEVTAILDARVVERVRLYVHLLAFTAARIETLRHVQWQDVDLVDSRIAFPHSNAKGRRGYDVPIAPELLNALAGSKEERGDNAYDLAYLLPARRRAQFIPEDEAMLWDRPASQMSLGRYLKAAATTAGVRAPEQITAHMFRRYTLEHIVNTYGIYVGAALAGHRSIQTTAGYAGRANREKVAEALQKTRLRDTSRQDRRDASMGALGFEPRLPAKSGDDADASGPGGEIVTPEDAS